MDTKIFEQHSKNIRQHMKLSKDICNIIDVGRDGNLHYNYANVAYFGIRL